MKTSSSVSTMCLVLLIGVVSLGCQPPDEGEAANRSATTASATRGQATPAPVPAAAPAPGATPAPGAASGAAVTLTGSLEHTPLPTTRSVEAYLGRAFTLTDAQGQAHNLKGSEAVSSDVLEGLDGQTITVRCEPYPPTAPSALEQAPLGADGAPMMRPGGCQVIEVLSAP